MQTLQALNKFLGRFTIPIGKWVGVPTYLHWSWVFCLIIVMIWNMPLALSMVGLFYIVLLHECGHCLAARRYNCYIRDITLYPFGGAAAMQMPETPKKELVITLCGPLVNLLLVPVLYLLSFLANIHFPETLIAKTFATVALYNVVLLIFNLVPAFPMDGGRVLRAILSMTLKDHLRATTIAARTGQVFAVLFFIAGLLAGPGLIVIGIFVFYAAEKELERTRIKRANFDAMSRFVPENGTPPPDEDVRASGQMLSGMSERLANLERLRRRRD